MMGIKEDLHFYYVLLVLYNTYIDFGKEFNDNDPKFKVGDHVRISKFKNFFAKGYTPNW